MDAGLGLQKLGAKVEAVEADLSAVDGVERALCRSQTHGMPGTYQAVYNGTKAFLDSFSYALRHELKDRGVSVTCLMPGATETEFFERADMLDAKIGTEKKDDPADVAKRGFEAMMRGDGQVITGWQNKLQAAITRITPSDALAEMYRRQAQPGTAAAE